MTGDEVVDQARVLFAERTALTLTNTEIQAFVNEALLELYRILSAEQNRYAVIEDTVILTSGKGALPIEWDRLLEVSDATGPITMVAQTTIANIDRLGSFFQPETPVWYYDGEHLHVRPADLGEVLVLHTAPPPRISNFANEIADLPEHYQPVLVPLTVAAAYAQEEDLEQANHFRTVALGTLMEATAAEQEAS